MAMAEASPIQTPWYEASAAAAPARARLAFDFDADIVVIGGGLAGLTIAYEAAKRGNSVVLIEARRIAWNASGRNGGVVMPGFAADINEVIERVGFDNARALWQLGQDGVDYVRDLVAANAMPGVALTDGWLQASRVETGDELIRRLQMLGEDFAVDVEGWQADKVRDALKSDQYFHAVHFPKAFHLHALNYALGLAELAEKAGVRIFEDTPAISIDPAGIRKRIVTPQARLRASHIVLAGNVHLGSPSPRLTDTLLPVWNYTAITAPLGERLTEAINYTGAVSDTDGIDHFRIVGGDRLMWANPSTTWQADPQRFAPAIARRIHRVFRQLGRVAIDEVWASVYGQTVHGMPQIGELRPGLWIASGFGRQGINTSAMAGQLISRAMDEGDDRWRLFSPFELVWAGGPAGRVVGAVLGGWRRGNAAFSAKVSRYHERMERRDRERQARVAASREATRRENQRRIADARAAEAEARGRAGQAASRAAAPVSRESEPVSDDRA
jgi:glycine/D-amino acid oxidase-like deaminating enzyme